MKEFSVIIPIYNAGKYLERCLNSVINQTFKNYEIIAVNDGSVDNSEKIIDSFCTHYSFIKKINKTNGGLSDARNQGIKNATGEYLIFLDADDYIDKYLLEKIDKIFIEKKYDLVKFDYDLVDDNNVKLLEDNLPSGEYTGEDFFIRKVLKKVPFELACIYAYKRSFWKEEKFEFSVGYYHEDVALVPKIILKAKNIYNLNYMGYHYVQTDSSITRNDEYINTKKRISDLVYHFDNLYEEVNKYALSFRTQKYFNSYISNMLILKIKDLKKQDQKKYIKALKQRHVFDLILSETLKQKLKKTYFKIKYINI